MIIIVSKRRLAELSHELSLAQKMSLGLMWLIAAFFGVTACFPEKVRKIRSANRSLDVIE